MGLEEEKKEKSKIGGDYLLRSNVCETNALYWINCQTTNVDNS